MANHPELKTLIKFLPLISAFSAFLLWLSISMDVKQPSRSPFKTSTYGLFEQEVETIAYNKKWSCKLFPHSSEVIFPIHPAQRYHYAYPSDQPLIKSSEEFNGKSKSLASIEPLELPIGWGSLIEVRHIYNPPIFIDYIHSINYCPDFLVQ